MNTRNRRPGKTNCKPPSTPCSNRTRHSTRRTNACKVRWTTTGTSTTRRSNAIRRDSLVQLLRRQPKFLGEGEWKKLALLTDSIYNRFTVRLKERFPQLTDVDLQYCILIKLLQQSEGVGLSPGEMLDSWLWKF